MLLKEEKGNGRKWVEQDVCRGMNCAVCRGDERAPGLFVAPSGRGEWRNGVDKGKDKDETKEKGQKAAHRTQTMEKNQEEEVQDVSYWDDRDGVRLVLFVEYGTGMRRRVWMESSATGYEDRCIEIL